MLEPELLQNLSAHDRKIFPSGTAIVDFDKYVKNIPIVLKGSVKVLSEDENGKEITLYHIKPGESCVASIIGAISQGKSKVQAVTIEDTEILLIDSKRMYDLIKSNPKWFSFFIQLYQSRFEELIEVVKRSNFSTHEERVLQLLQQRSKLLNTKVIEITHKQIAEEFGTSREVISRVLKKMESEGKLKIGRGKILLKTAYFG